MTTTNNATTPSTFDRVMKSKKKHNKRIVQKEKNILFFF